MFYELLSSTDVFPPRLFPESVCSVHQIDVGNVAFIYSFFYDPQRKYAHSGIKKFCVLSFRYARGWHTNNFLWEWNEEVALAKLNLEECTKGVHTFKCRIVQCTDASFTIFTFISIAWKYFAKLLCNKINLIP